MAHVHSSTLQAIGNTPLVKLEDYNPTGSYKDRMARRLSREEGVFTGTSSGLNVVAALQLAQELGVGHTVVTVAVDTGLKYLAGDLFEGDKPAPL